MTHLPDPIQAILGTLWLLAVPLVVVIVNAVISSLAALAVRAAALRVVLAAICGWVQLYTRFLDEYERDIRRADFRSDLLWGRYRRLRRRGYAGADLAMHLLLPVIKDMPGDLVEAVASFVVEQTTMVVYRVPVMLSIAKRHIGRLTGTPDRIRLQQALATLAAEHGYFVCADRDALACCSNCGWTDVPDEARGAVFWNAQSDGYAFDGDAGYCDSGYSDWLRHTLYLQWGGNGRLIAQTLRAAGFQVRWNGRRKTAIAVLPSPEHADPACDDPDCRPVCRRRLTPPTSAVGATKTATRRRVYA